LIAATHTPFTPSGDLNLDPLPKLAEFLISHGIIAVFIGGTTGESHSLTLDERQQLTRRWVEVVKGSSLKVIAHVGANCRSDSLELAREAYRVGVHATAALSPSFFKPSSVSDLIDYLTPIARAGRESPFYFYDIPSMTNLVLPMREFLEKAPASIPNLRGLKYSNPDSVQLQECLQFQNGAYEILYGIDEILLTAMVLGVQGAVGSSYNFAAPIYRRLSHALSRADWPAAREAQFQSVRVIRLLAQYGYLGASKFLMRLHGLDLGTVRSPLKRLSQPEESALQKTLEESGLWESIR
jgi:N-acetylneuraminate lyase